MLAEHIFFFKAASQSRQTHLQVLSERQLLLWDSSTPQSSWPAESFSLGFSGGSENVFSRLCCPGWKCPGCIIRWEGYSICFIKELDKRGGTEGGIPGLGSMQMWHGGNLGSIYCLIQWAKAEGEEMAEALSKALTSSCPALLLQLLHRSSEEPW